MHDPVHNLVSKAHRATLIATLLRMLSWRVATVAAAAVVMATLSRFTSVNPWPVVYPVAAVLLISLMLQLRELPRRLHVAMELDRQYATSELLSTAMQIEHAPEDSVPAAVRHRAGERATRLDLAQFTPGRYGTGWWILALILAGLVPALYVPAEPGVVRHDKPGSLYGRELRRQAERSRAAAPARAADAQARPTRDPASGEQASAAASEVGTAATGAAQAGGASPHAGESPGGGVATTPRSEPSPDAALTPPSMTQDGSANAEARGGSAGQSAPDATGEGAAGRITPGAAAPDVVERTGDSPASEGDAPATHHPIPRRYQDIVERYFER